MWPSIFTIDDLLTPTEVKEALNRVETAQFVDGGVSAGGANLDVKNNREMTSERQYMEIVKIIERAVRGSTPLNLTVFPRFVTRCIVSRYEDGMSYGRHIDSPVMGFMTQEQAYGPFGQNYVRSDFSMTVFLSDPDSYEGGELSFDSPFGPQTYKLPAGSAVAYPTGVPHQVTPVIGGTRLAAVMWLQSMIRDHEQRRLVSELYLLAERLGAAEPKSGDARTARELAATALRIMADI